MTYDKESRDKESGEESGGQNQGRIEGAGYLIQFVIFSITLWFCVAIRKKTYEYSVIPSAWNVKSKRLDYNFQALGIDGSLNKNDHPVLCSHEMAFRTIRRAFVQLRKAFRQVKKTFVWGGMVFVLDFLVHLQKPVFPWTKTSKTLLLCSETLSQILWL